MPVHKKSSARRCLFGRPTVAQQEATRQWLDAGLEQHYRDSADKWGFDFKLGVPLASTSRDIATSSATTSDYVYEIVAESSVPRFYRCRNLSASSSSSSRGDESPKSSCFDREVMEEKIVNISSCSESDISMEFEPVPVSKRASHTPKKRGLKLTDYIPIRRKKIQKSPKSPKSPASRLASPARRF